MATIAPWFPDAKFGVFIHWVLKSAWMDDPSLYNENDPNKNYRKHPELYAQHFTAENYDPKQWASMFKSWGAKYAVLTTKHHIGFALFDHPDSKFTAAKSSPAGRDLLKGYCDALREEGLKVGLYYSLPDWSHPDYASVAGGDDPMKYSEQDEPERWKRFTDHMFEEIRHLLTNYGRIDLLWFDGDWERSADQWRSVELMKMIQELQPHIIVNNRLRHKCIGHYGTPESTAPLRPRGEFWEFCTTPGDNWDGQRANQNVKPPHELQRIFGDMIGMGGNLLLNVAPSTDGTIPEVQTSAMAGLGQWIVDHAEAVYGSEAGLPFGLFNGSSTHNGSVLYLIAYDRPQYELVVKGIKSTPSKVTHLRTGKELEWRKSGGRSKFGQAGWMYITLPADCFDDMATVIKCEFEGDELEITTPSGDTLKWSGRPALTEQELYDEKNAPAG
ncbi:MAG: alpha-L-fucosidase [Phycisphaerae bacterium]